MWFSAYFEAQRSSSSSLSKRGCLHPKTAYPKPKGDWHKLRWHNLTITVTKYMLFQISSLSMKSALLKYDLLTRLIDLLRLKNFFFFFLLIRLNSSKIWFTPVYEMIGQSRPLGSVTISGGIRISGLGWSPIKNTSQFS